VSAPVIIGEPCGCQVLEDPDMDWIRYVGIDEITSGLIDDWLDAHVEGWRDGAITALAHADGVLSLQRNVGGTRNPDLHIGDDGGHVAQMVLTVNVDETPMQFACRKLIDDLDR
jgi:hypothetical protein